MNLYSSARQVALLGIAPRHLELANHWEDGGTNLYHCTGDGRGFFVEVGVDDRRGQAVVRRSFGDLEAPADYAH